MPKIQLTNGMETIVTKERNQSVYRVSIKVGDRIVKINSFKHERHAALAYDLWAKDLFKEYALLNFTDVG